MAGRNEQKQKKLHIILTASEQAIARMAQIGYAPLHPPPKIIIAPGLTIQRHQEYFSFSGQQFYVS
jgi:hypothetical protein